jgi:SAM-dependent methyltransferase
MVNSCSVFDAYSRYYDLLYSDKDYEGEVGYVCDVLARFGIGGGDLLELGSGTGKHGRLLAKRGYRVHGIERSAEMVARAEPAIGFTCEQGDICTANMGRVYNAVLSLFHVISYQTGNDDLHAVFSRASEHLLSGGLFIFDFWYTPAVYTLRPSTRVKRMADAHTEITRIAEPHSHPNEDRVDVQYTIYAKDAGHSEIKVMSELHRMRHFSLPEIDLLAEAAGFTRVGAEEFLTSNTPSEHTWGVCVMLQKD